MGDLATVNGTVKNNIFSGDIVAVCVLKPI
jgi:hypothetical protein